ncbi:MAG TPA: hypothetical protein P5206_02995 [Paludibacteraceae bacterium]|nr:hypothetical protein [Paludibacteraceae bacterium]HRU72436.1 hypothetical protein [Paludibacteraceae bacterium]
MKTKRNLFVLVALATTITISAQKVALHSNGTVQHFEGATAFVNAYNASASGDTIYLPGGSFNPPAEFTKTLSIIGAGHYPDSSVVTGKTFINGNIVLKEDADNCLFEGVHITGTFSTANNEAVDYLTVKSSSIDGNISFQGDLSNPSKNISIIRCVVRHCNLGNAQNAYFANSIISNGSLTKSSGNLFENNIILRSPTYNTFVFIDGGNNIIKNNVIKTAEYTNHISNGIGNTYYNNLFVSSGPSLGANAVASGNYYNVGADTIFVNQTGITFNYSHDYHLKQPEVWIGTDNTQIGIYGGTFPYKEGAIPSNPHFQEENIAPTATSGQLNVQIKVAAQDN